MAEEQHSTILASASFDFINGIVQWIERCRDMGANIHIVFEDLMQRLVTQHIEPLLFESSIDIAELMSHFDAIEHKMQIYERLKVFVVQPHKSSNVHYILSAMQGRGTPDSYRTVMNDFLPSEITADIIGQTIGAVHHELAFNVLKTLCEKYTMVLHPPVTEADVSCLKKTIGEQIDIHDYTGTGWIVHNVCPCLRMKCLKYLMRRYCPSISYCSAIYISKTINAKSSDRKPCKNVLVGMDDIFRYLTQ